MEFLFNLTPYDSPALDAEAAELMRQRLEMESRRAVPGIWKVTDHLNARASKGPDKPRTHYRIYGVILITLGVISLVPGLMEPRIPSLIVTGGFAIICGLWCFFLRQRKPLDPPASCRKEAAKLLDHLRSLDWNALQTCVRFDGEQLTIASGDFVNAVPYGEFQAVFASEHLWMLLQKNRRAILLQKKDLYLETPENFGNFLQNKIKATNYS